LHRLTVLYGHPLDPAEFDRYYYEVHLPIARAMKNLKSWTIGKLAPSNPGEQLPYYMIVTMLADTREELDAILASPEGMAAAADVPNFANGGATFMLDEVEVIV
jgi:uncharacterized protein (TIGR02118 family)